MSSKPNLRVALVQCEIASNDVEKNLAFVRETVSAHASSADMVIFPETITTGFSSDASQYADQWECGRVYQTLRQLAQEYQTAICASYLVRDGELRANRFVLFDEFGSVQWQDKRHLFSFGGEPDMVSATEERRILTYRGWRILPIICYDLRFPVWCRNVQNEYDVLICLANWPKPRRDVWSTLLKARAMENLTYSIGVNRVGVDASGLVYTGDSALFDSRGRLVTACAEGCSQVAVAELEYAPLVELRQKFPVWQDADPFTLH
ncbi:MAG: nitrilase-related carbon-nitrogen hydrolase [Porphyromonadaceae bacterium]|nr:nitrilase-related carbon-nitrogen hydrolase [Porphyromonadaceae bacterium]